MLSQAKLYRIWHREIKANMGEQQPASRIQNMVWLVVGMYLAGNIHLSKIARKLPIRAQKLSLERRLRRLLANEGVDVAVCYNRVVRRLLAAAAVGGQVRLIVDGSKVGHGHRMLMVGLAYQRRSLPLAWHWMGYKRGASSLQAQRVLLGRVQALLPAGVQVSLVGDHEFGHPDVMALVETWGWQYVLRQAGSNVFQHQSQVGWQRYDQIALTRGDLMGLSQITLTRTRTYTTHAVLYWKRSEAQPWYLATNLASPHLALHLYRRRMWIEEMFGDMKKHGFDLEATRLRHAERLNRLTLAVCWLFVWLVSLGEYVLKQHLHAEVDRAGRRDLSIFRLGWDWLERRLALSDPLPTCFVPSFSLVSGS